MTRTSQISGIYPHLTHTNYDPDHASECAVAVAIPWAGKLWTITYPAHMPRGSVDKLRSINPQLEMEEHSASVGGTHANRFIHKESRQMIIGLHFIDEEGNVRTIAPEDMPGRHTAVARHLNDPETKVYFYEMEGALYEVDVHTLKVKRLFEKAVQGWHGKGAYSGQGRLVIANNGDWDVPGANNRPYQVEDFPETTDRAGALAEWDGEKWTLLERVQHCEVTGPGGIYGNPSKSDPIWCTGFDRRSVLLKCLDENGWRNYRLPKGSYTHDGNHGWHTEWPRIREIEEDFLLMHMHGLLWDFPKTFSSKNSSGLMPLASYHKMMVDYCSWEGKIAMACNDTTVFGNDLVTQAESNLRFLCRHDMEDWGPRAGFGGPCVNDDIKAGEVSDAYLISGFDQRVMMLSHGSRQSRSFRLEIDQLGNDIWETYKELKVEEGRTETTSFPPEFDAVWIRVVSLDEAKDVTAYFVYSEMRKERSCELFRGLVSTDHDKGWSGGIIRPLGSDSRSLHFLARTLTPSGEVIERNLEVTKDFQFKAYEDLDKTSWFQEKGNMEHLDFEVDDASVIIRDQDGGVYRLPKVDEVYDQEFNLGYPRGKREVVTERSLWNCHGTFYELPRDNSGGVPKIQPISTHQRLITDFCSWQGMLVLAGVDLKAEDDVHIIKSEEENAALWLGDVDDLWKFGKPTGEGGPWKDTEVEENVPSHPYLMLGYDQKSMSFSHDSDASVILKLEVDPSATGVWSTYDSYTIQAGEKFNLSFPDGFSTHWIRAVVDRPCKVTCQFRYE